MRTRRLFTRGCREPGIYRRCSAVFRWMTRRVLVGAAVFAAWTGSLAAQGTAGTEVLLNESTGSVVYARPAVVTLPNSTVIVVWEDRRLTVGQLDHAIFAQKVTFPGYLGENILVSRRSWLLTKPDAAYLTRPNQLGLVWQQYDSAGNASAIRYAVFDTSFAPAVPPVTIAAGRATNPRVRQFDSRAVIAWQQSFDKEAVFLQEWDYLGARISDTLRLNDLQSLNAFLPDVAVSGDAYFTVWVDKRDGKRAVYFQKCAIGAFRWGGNIRVSEAPDRANVGPPVVATDIRGNALVAWTDARDGDWKVYAAFVDPEGTISGPNLLVDAKRRSLRFGHVAVAWCNGAYLVVWESDDGGRQRLSARWILPGGAFADSSFSPVSTGDFDSVMPALAVDRDAVYLAWLDNRWTERITQYDIMVTRLKSPLTGIREMPAPREMRLAVYPNPFPGTGTVLVTADASRRVDIELIDVLGRTTRNIYSGLVPGGEFAISVNERLSPGMYVLQAVSGRMVKRIKVLASFQR